MLPWLWILVAVMFWMLPVGATPARAEIPKRNTCAACHTSGSRIIAITQKLAKERPAVKSESEGEG